LLRREGLYASHLSHWRQQMKLGLLPKRRGREGSDRHSLLQEKQRLLRENQQLKQKLQRAELLLDIQKKASALLEIPLNPPESGGSDS